MSTYATWSPPASNGSTWHWQAASLLLGLFRQKGVSISVPSDAHGGWAEAPGQFGSPDVQAGWCGSWSSRWRRR